MSIRNLSKQINPTIQNELELKLSEHELAALSKLSTLVELPEGKAFANEGAVGREAVVIVQGEAAVMRDGEQIAVVGKGDIVGELSLLFNTPRNATLVSTTPIVVAALNRREFHSFLELCPRLQLLVKDEAELRSA